MDIRARATSLAVFGAPCQLRLLAGQEHGRTIPLADISGPEILEDSDNSER
jgi:hypothetical protein